MKIIRCLIIALFICNSIFAQSDVNHLLTKLKTSRSDSERAVAYNLLCLHYQYANTDSSVYYATEGIKYFTTRGYKPGIAKMTSLLASQDETQGRMELARSRYTEALAMFKEINNIDGEAAVNNGLGTIEGKAGNFNAATKHFMDALKLYESISSKKGMVGTYLKLGVVNELSDNLDKALEYYGKVQKMTADDSLSANRIYLYNNIGIVYGKKGDYKKAREYLQAALETTTKPEYTGVRILSLLNMGIVCDNEGDDVQALKYFNEALQITKDKDLPEESTRVMVNMSSVIRKTDPARAIAMLNEALMTAIKINQRTLQQEILNNLVANYKAMGNYKEALSTYERSKDLQDSMFTVDKAKEIANLQAEFELKQSTAKVQELELLGQKNIMQRNIIIMVALIMAITLIALTFFLRRITLLNEQLSKREKELQKSNTVKDKLFSIIGHDLRGPMANIPMMLQIYMDEQTTPDERAYIQSTLIEHSQASLGTLDKLLYWGQAQLKGAGMKPVNFDPKTLVQNNLLLIKSNADQKNITITDNLQPGLTAQGDPAHFDFIVRNLLSNALKFSHPGGSVTINADDKMQPGFNVFSIKDSGIGIAPDKISEIFEPYSNSTRGTSDERGTSIGLMLCKEFVIENGGNIWVESEPDKGSAFYFSFRTGHE